MTNTCDEKDYVKVHKSQLNLWSALVYQAWLMLDNELDDTDHNASHFSELASSVALLGDFLVRIERFLENE